MKRIIIALCLLMVFSKVSWSQTNFQKGFILSIEGDTLTGEIDYQEWYQNPDTVVFRSNPDSDLKSFSPADIDGFYVSGNLYYSAEVSVDQTPFKFNSTNDLKPIEQSSIIKKVFLSVLVQGTVDLYLYRHSRDNFYLKTDEGIFELISHEYVALNTKDELVIKGELTTGLSKYRVMTGDKDNYKYQLKHHFPSCSYEEIDQLRYTAKHLMNFVVSCNQQMGADEITFIKKLDKTRIGGRIFTGVSSSMFNEQLFSNDTKRFYSTIQFTLGATANFILPGELGRKSFFVGVQYFSINTPEGEEMRSFTRRETNMCGGIAGPCVVETVTTKRNSNISATFLRFDVGYSFTFNQDKIQPFVTVGTGLSKKLEYSSKQELILQTYHIRDQIRTLENESVSEPVITSPDEYYLSLFGGLGAKYGPWSIELRADYGHRFPKRVPIYNAFLLFGFQIPFQ